MSMFEERLYLYTIDENGFGYKVDITNKTVGEVLELTKKTKGEHRIATKIAIVD